jgi:hypothetical protein
VDHERVLAERVVHHVFPHADGESELLEEHVVGAAAGLVIIALDAYDRRVVIRKRRSQR